MVDGKKQPEKEGESKSVSLKSSINDNWDIRLDEINVEKEIGRGAFGVVLRGLWRGIPGTLTEITAMMNNSCDQKDEQ